ncbi:hypothetical protein CBP51_10545 [Cellvibrio mixtus]|uniref:Uncharacterized protein n=1 Tax=Cellvibrio mixtus TaxID=39650 RepID=A0A266QBZ9_9GAMM|nr:hypothetical protein [Cellvibrio mixtus]OZY87392.1 hypothetical protein CBP51_10545 [Cellvibrio mixtus]
MVPSNRQDPPEGLNKAGAYAPHTSEQWLRLCDDFANLDGQCALLCELLTHLSRRDTPLEPAGQHGIDMLVSQLREGSRAFKQQLYKMRAD